MSFRELRDFTEIMKALGYPRLISVENFRTPNFLLVADVLFWLVRRYDPNADLPDRVEHEDDRVEFLKRAAQVMAQKARLKLNIKQLYRADGYAVKELLKICTLLYEALNVQADNLAPGSDLPLMAKLEELKEARTLASDIVESGEKLYRLLGREEEIRPAREQALQFVDSISLNLESNDSHDLIERRIREQINTITDSVSELQKTCAQLDEDHTALVGKIERKQTELERAEKRFKSLKKVKPQFMEEFEQHESELKLVFDSYLEKFRNLQYLESELAKYQRAEQEKKREHDRSLAKMQQRLREEELRILRGDQEVNETHLDNEVYDSGREDEGSSGDDDLDRRRPGVARGRPAAASGARPGGNSGYGAGRSAMAGKVQGSLTAGGSSDDESEESERSKKRDDDDDDDDRSGSDPDNLSDGLDDNASGHSGTPAGDDDDDYF